VPRLPRIKSEFASVDQPRIVQRRT